MQREAEILAASFSSANTIGEALGKLIVIPDRRGKAKEAARWVTDVEPLTLAITAATTFTLLADVLQLHGIDNREKLTEVLVKIWKVPDAPA